MREFPVGGEPWQVVWAVEAGADGSMWFAQQWQGTASSNPADRMRVGRVDAAGQVVASTELDGNGSWSGLAATSDGGVWVHRAAQPGGFVHLEAHGAVTADVPAAALSGHQFTEDVVTGPDDAAWTWGCSYPSGDEHCSALRVSLAGGVTSYPLPSFSSPDWRWMSDASAVPAAGGMWVGRTLFDTEAHSDAAFVDFNGDVQDVALPVGAAVVGATANGSAWWKQDVPRRFGLVSPAGAVHSVREYPFDPADESDFVSAAAGRGDTLVWAADAIGDAQRDGRLAILGPQGDLVFEVPTGATAVQEGPGFWSGSCVFGAGALHVAVDGAAWSVSTGHPDRISRLTPAGGFTNFVVPSATVDTNLRLRDLSEASDASLWFAVETATGPRLARADPLDPPEGLPPFPSGSGMPVSPRQPPHQRFTHYPGLRLTTRRLAPRRVRVSARVKPTAIGRLSLTIRIGGRTIRRASGRRRALVVTLHTRDAVRATASFQGRDGWAARARRTVAPAASRPRAGGPT